MATRLSKVVTGDADAVVAAAAALHRLGQHEMVSEYLDPTWFTPQVGQGVVAVEARSDDEDIVAALRPLHDDRVAANWSAERSFLRAMGGGCAVPAGAYAFTEGDEIVLTGVLLHEDGIESVRASVRGTVPDSLGDALLAQLLANGGQDLWRVRP
jgi:hydroxymethylbilane synthase